MTSASGNATGLEILLSTLKSSYDVQNTLSILQVLDELLSAGTVKRIRYMISKGGSEALLHTLINMTRIFPPNYDVLLPLLHLIIKVGQRVVTGAALGKSGITRLLFKLISPYTTRNTKAVRAAIEALSALLKSKWNCRRAVDNGYIHRLLKLYQDWHQRDSQNKFISIHKALLNCIKNITNIQAGKKAFLQADGMRVLLSASQAYGSSPGLQPVIKLATQVMRKCHPKQPLPLLIVGSCYSFLLPNAEDSQPLACPSMFPQEVIAMKEDDEEQDDEDNIENEEPVCNEDDDDLETDLTRLRPNPQLDRTVEELKQYERLCPELTGYFEDSGRNPNGPSGGCTLNPSKHKTKKMHLNMQRPSVDSSKACIQTVTGEERPPFLSQSWSIDSEQNGQHAGYKLSQMRREMVPLHDPHVYTMMAEKTRSASNYKSLAFPDYWGHISPVYQEPLTGQWSGHQRDKIFEDIQRLVSPGDILNKVVFDADSIPLVTSEDDISLKFFSHFESGNLRKAIKIRKYEYDLIMNADINTELQHQWFYFKLSGMRAGIPYRFNIINCEKTNSQFNYGMQPVMYSVHEALCGRPHWIRVGSDIYYYK